MAREEQIARLLGHYFEVAWTTSGAKWDGDNLAEIRELAGLICATDPVGQRGSGVCICQASPAWQEESSKFRGYQGWLDEMQRARSGNAILDHRCPEHGERAQPRLWGRHKELTLQVSAREWASLGVVYKREEV